MTLVERDREVAVLNELAASATSGEGRVAVLTGPPGIGKTALLAAVRRDSSASLRAFTAVGGELDRDLPFGVVRQLFESALRRAGDADDQLLSGAAGLAAPVFSLDRERRDVGGLGDVVHGLYWLCANLAETSPLAIFVDDVQWADDASLRFLSHLARRIDGLPVLVVAAARSGGAADELMVRVFGGVDVVVVQPAPLSPAGVSRLVRGRLGEDADEDFCVACAVACGGNPFLLTEALDALRDDRVPPRAGEVDRVARLRPQTITRSVLSRIARLGPEAVRFARALAILGPHCAHGQLGEFGGLSTTTTPAVADVLARESIIGSGVRADFLHPLIREAVYGDMSAMYRAAEHKRAAHLLQDSGGDVERVATQLLATDPATDGWALAALRRGAAAALARGAPESAVAFLTRARSEPPVPDEVAAVDAELARALGMAGRLTDAARLFHTAIAGGADDSMKFALSLELAVVLHRAGRGREAVQAVQLARQFVEWDDLSLPAPLQGVLAVADFVAMEPPSVWTARLDRISGDLGDGELDRTVLAIRALGAAAMGDRTAAEVAELALRAADGPVPRDDTGTLVVMAGSALTVCGETAAALTLFDAGLDSARGLGNRAEFGYLAVVRSHVAWFAGQLAEAEADARHGLEEVAGEPRTLNTYLAAAALIDALVERGEIAEAANVLDDYELDSRDVGEAMIDHFVPLARGALRLAQHKPRLALQNFLDCGQLLTTHGYTNPGFAPWRAGAIAAHAALGEMAQASVLATENLRLARAFEAPQPIALALRMTARAAGAESRMDHLTEAADIVAKAPDMLESAHVLVEYGTELCRVGKQAEARSVLVEGLELAATFGASPLVATAKRELRLIGVRPRRSATSGRRSLTASELRVATLAAEGATNREIAQTLFVTTRTVEIHLTNAYRKLNIDSRGTLPAALAQ